LTRQTQPDGKNRLTFTTLSLEHCRVNASAPCCSRIGCVVICISQMQLIKCPAHTSFQSATIQQTEVVYWTMPPLSIHQQPETIASINLKMTALTDIYKILR